MKSKLLPFGIFIRGFACYSMRALDDDHFDCGAG